MRGMTAAGRVFAAGLMVVFSLALAGQSAWGAETSTKARSDKQGASSYKKNPGNMSIAKAEFEGTEGKRDNQSMKVHEKERIIAIIETCDVALCQDQCTITYRKCYDEAAKEGGGGEEQHKGICQTDKDTCDDWCVKHNKTAAEKECELTGMCK